MASTMDEETLDRIKFRRQRIAKRQAQKDGTAEQAALLAAQQEASGRASVPSTADLSPCSSASGFMLPPALNTFQTFFTPLPLRLPR